MPNDSLREFSLLLPDGSSRTYPVGTTALEVAQSIGPRLAQWCIELMSLRGAFLVTAGLLVLSGLMCLGLTDRVVRDSAIHH